MDNVKKDPNVESFMMQLVQEKHGDDISQTFLNDESDRLYELFSQQLVKSFEPQLSEEDKSEFDEIVKRGGSQDEMFAFLLQSINDLEEQIMNVLIEFRLGYLKKQEDNNTEQQI